MNFKICFQHSVLLEMSSFEKISQAVLQKFGKKSKQPRYDVLVQLLLELLVVNVSKFLNFPGILWKTNIVKRLSSAYFGERKPRWLKLANFSYALLHF